MFRMSSHDYFDTFIIVLPGCCVKGRKRVCEQVGFGGVVVSTLTHFRVKH